ncbi:hypothetical protein RvY_00050 [Ramazzottius varieornatus]|uniref:Uncharacterized protein n=1 Tax=Ramazzottius varieornatus TaxID=947166 RepID=A0A1D1UIT7_RAMVA|nr:hypothetical protein RvY_00050 [Ramazzottius varieornatus]
MAGNQRTSAKPDPSARTFFIRWEEIYLVWRTLERYRASRSCTISMTSIQGTSDGELGKRLTLRYANLNGVE